MEELRGSQSASITAVKSAVNLLDGVKKFESSFERAGVKRYDRRLRWVSLAFDKFNELDASIVCRTRAARSHANVHRCRPSPERRGQVLVDRSVCRSGRTAPDQGARRGRDAPATRDDPPFPFLKGCRKLLPRNWRRSETRYPPSGRRPSPQLAPTAHGPTEALKLIFAKAEENLGKLDTHYKTLTNGVNGCAWAVNSVVQQALGKPINTNNGFMGLGTNTRDMHLALQGGRGVPILSD